MLENFGIDTVIMIVLAAVIGVYLYRLDKKEKSDPLAALYKQYASLSAEQLSATSDGELVRAVVSNVLAKTDRRHPDVYRLISVLSHGRIAVYSVWLLCNELEAADIATLLRSPSGRFVETALDGLSLIGAHNCVEALTAVLESPQDDTLLRSAITQEQPLLLCVSYIREFPEEFIDL